MVLAGKPPQKGDLRVTFSVVPYDEAAKRLGVDVSKMDDKSA